MPSGIEVGDFNASLSDHKIDLNSTFARSVTPGPERVIYNCKVYLRRPSLRAAETPSVI
jgi:hypothetical protein